MYYGGLGYYYFDPTYILVLICAVISMIASARVNSVFNKYNRVAAAASSIIQLLRLILLFGGRRRD